MTTIYTPTSVSGYNANPPPDDGTQVPNNLVTWANTKTKIGDPLNTAVVSVDSNVTAAVGKLTDGAAVLAITTNYQVLAADQGKLIKVTQSGVTITTPDATAVGAPFMFHVLNLSTGTITLAGNANGPQDVDGQTSQVLQPGSGCACKTDGSNWFTFGLKSAQINTAGAVYGFNQPINLSLLTIVSGGVLAVEVKTVAGNDPSAGDPVLIPFRDSNPTLGDPVWRTVTSALSINTNSTGASLGTSNNVPFRFWIVAFDNAGTVVLGLINCSTSSQIFPLDQNVSQSTTQMTASATSAGVFYTPNGITLGSKPFRILGWLEYSGGLATAGVYSAGPTLLQLFGPGCKLPGDRVGMIFSQTSSSSSTQSTSYVASNVTATLSITSTANPILVTVAGGGSTSAVSLDLTSQILRGSTPIGTALALGGSSSDIDGSISLRALDQPNATSQAYTLGFKTSNAASGVTIDNGSISVEEIMG